MKGHIVISNFHKCSYNIDVYAPITKQVFILGYIGWRSSYQDCSLELFGPLYQSFKRTLPTELPVYTIILG